MSVPRPTPGEPTADPPTTNGSVQNSGARTASILPLLPLPNPVERLARRRAIGVAALYAVVGILWIAGSDRLAEGLAQQPSQLQTVQLLKGSGFVLVTAVLLAVLMLRYVRCSAKTEHQHEQKQQLFQLVVEGSGDPVFVKDRNGRFLMANPAFARAFDRPLDEVLGRLDTEVFPGNPVGLIENIDPAFLGEHPSVTREESVPVRGQTSTFLTTTTPYRDGKGEICGWLGIARDITSQKRDAEARLLSFSLLEATLESTADGLLVVDTAGRVARFNQNFAEMWRVPAELLTLGNDDRLLKFAVAQVESPDQFLARVRDLYSRPEVESLDVIRLKDGRTLERLSKPQRLGERIVGRVWSFRDVTSRVEAEKRLRQSRAQLRELTANLQVMRENERTRIAREIHDQLGQSLTGLKMDVNWMHSRLPLETETLRHKLGEILELIDATVETVRRIATELRPGVLDSLGLEAALEWQVEDFGRRSGIAATFSGPSGRLDLDEDRRTAVFRICQESLTNVARYAQARTVQVQLERRADELRLLVTDDGVGFAAEALSKNGSFGIVGMRERARLLGGRLDLRSAPGRGTEVELLLPISGPPIPGDPAENVT